MPRKRFLVPGSNKWIRGGSQEVSTVASKPLIRGTNDKAPISSGQQKAKWNFEKGELSKQNSVVGERIGRYKWIRKTVENGNNNSECPKTVEEKNPKVHSSLSEPDCSERLIIDFSIEDSSSEKENSIGDTNEAQSRSNDLCSEQNLMAKTNEADSDLAVVHPKQRPAQYPPQPPATMQPRRNKTWVNPALLQAPKPEAKKGDDIAEGSAEDTSALGSKTSKGKIKWNKYVRSESTLQSQQGGCSGDQREQPSASRQASGVDNMYSTEIRKKFIVRKAKVSKKLRAPAPIKPSKSPSKDDAKRRVGRVQRVMQLLRLDGQMYSKSGGKKFGKRFKSLILQREGAGSASSPFKDGKPTSGKGTSAVRLELLRRILKRRRALLVPARTKSLKHSILKRRERLKGPRIIYCPVYCHTGHCPRRHTGCPLKHDPTKRAVCTKWLAGKCKLGKACRLQHQKCPDLMPVCLHFLHGKCNKTNCPYLHSIGRKDAPYCKAFLRGYCAAGTSCADKHFTLKQIKQERRLFAKSRKGEARQSTETQYAEEDRDRSGGGSDPSQQVSCYVLLSVQRMHVEYDLMFEAFVADGIESSFEATCRFYFCCLCFCMLLQADVIQRGRKRRRQRYFEDLELADLELADIQAAAEMQAAFFRRDRESESDEDSGNDDGDRGDSDEPMALADRYERGETDDEEETGEDEEERSTAENEESSGIEHPSDVPARYRSQETTMGDRSSSVRQRVKQRRRHLGDRNRKMEEDSSRTVLPSSVEESPSHSCSSSSSLPDFIELA